MKKFRYLIISLLFVLVPIQYVTPNKSNQVALTKTIIGLILTTAGGVGTWYSFKKKNEYTKMIETFVKNIEQLRRLNKKKKIGQLSKSEEIKREDLQCAIEETLLFILGNEETDGLKVSDIKMELEEKKMWWKVGIASSILLAIGGGALTLLGIIDFLNMGGGGSGGGGGGDGGSVGGGYGGGGSLRRRNAKTSKTTGLTTSTSQPRKKNPHKKTTTTNSSSRKTSPIRPTKKVSGEKLARETGFGGLREHFDANMRKFDRNFDENRRRLQKNFTKVDENRRRLQKNFTSDWQEFEKNFANFGVRLDTGPTGKKSRTRTKPVAVSARRERERREQEAREIERLAAAKRKEAREEMRIILDRERRVAARIRQEQEDRERHRRQEQERLERERREREAREAAKPMAPARKPTAEEMGAPADLLRDPDEPVEYNRDHQDAQPEPNARAPFVVPDVPEGPPVVEYVPNPLTGY